MDEGITHYDNGEGSLPSEPGTRQQPKTVRLVPMTKVYKVQILRRRQALKVFYDENFKFIPIEQE